MGGVKAVFSGPVPGHGNDRREGYPAPHRPWIPAEAGMIRLRRTGSPRVGVGIPARGEGVYSVIPRRIFDWGFGLVCWGGWLAMEDARWTMPLLYGTERVRRPYAVQRGFGRPGAGGRYRPAALMCSTRHGLVRAGCTGWLLRGWLHCAKASKGPGSSCRGRAGVICPTLPVRPGAGHTGGFEFGAEGHRGLLGSVRPLHEGA